MCSIVQNLTEIGREEGRAEGREEGRMEGRMEGRETERLCILKKMIQKHVSKEEIFDYGFSQEEYAQAEQSLLINA